MTPGEQSPIDNAMAHHDRGQALAAASRYEEALAGFDQAIAVERNFPEAHCNRATVLAALGRKAEALESYAKALELEPEFAEAHFNSGNVHRDMENWHKALADYDRALSIKPEHAETHSNRGLVLQRLNRLEEALESFDRAIEIKSDFARAHVNRGMASLLRGDFDKGWPDYEWRWRLEDSTFVHQRRHYAKPRWRGTQSLQGKILLMHAEQGFGDTLQFCRYAKLAADRGAQVILEVQAPLASLLATQVGVAQVVSLGDPLPEFDYYIPLMSLPLAVGTALSAVPVNVPYLKSNAEKVRWWSAKLGESTKRRVGLVWSGGIRSVQFEPWWVDDRRNISLAKLAALRSPDLEFYSLQKGSVAESELRELAAGGWDGPPITDFTQYLHDFSDTAAFMEHLDLIVTVDTATAHLAGALGRPVWILNRFDSCWRWLMNRTDSPWYPTARIYRQQRAGDWDGVITDVSRDLNGLCAASTPTSSLRLAVDCANSAEALTLRGLSEYELGQPDAALASFEAAIAYGPDYVPAHINRGIVLRECNRRAQALESFDSALVIGGPIFEALYNRAAVLTDLRRFDEALMDCNRALGLRPHQPEIHLAAATALLGLERYPQALAGYDRALSLRPAYAEAHAGRAATLQFLQRHAEALESSERALMLAPQLAAGHFNRGAALRDLMRIDEAVMSFARARALQPEDPETHCNLAGLLLLLGRFDLGWGMYEWRSRLPDAPNFHRYTQHRWDADADMRGKTVFLYLDQGLGDTIQFCRYATLIEERGAHVVISIQSRLRRLLSSLSPTLRIVGETEAPESFDYHCPLASLPGAFKTTAETIPAHRSYLASEPQRAARWRQRLGEEGFKIGICWHCSTIKTGTHRSFPLSALRGISTLPKVRLISLQQAVGTEQLVALPPGMRVETLGEAYDTGPDAFLDTAAVMDSLDLVITCDTSIAHVAGALGRPTWVVLKCVPDWRWMLGRDDSPWYPSIRLFRQTTNGHWDNVFDVMRRELQARVESLR